MTWIVGRAMPFGFAAAVSDIRVTTPNGHKDCLQKVYEVGGQVALFRNEPNEPFMAMGFAGSVFIGFRMVNRLRELLAPADSDKARDPEAVAKWWPKYAREVFEQEAQLVDDPNCELMLLSVHPTENLGVPNWAKCYVHLFRSPNFEAELAEPDGIFPGGSKAVAIGCGNESAPYRALLEQATEYNPGSFGPVIHGEFTSRLLVGIRITIANDPIPDVSPLLQLCTVNRLHVTVIDANGKRYGANSFDDFTVPKLATNFDELDLELQGLGGAANARC